MGWFNKKEEQNKKQVSPSLPNLPELPELPSFDDMSTDRIPLHQLPRFPNNSLGEKFSQDTIKQAVTGKKEGEGDFEADDYEENEMNTMPKPLTQQVTENFSFPKKETPYRFKEKIIEAEPIFIRIDKFEESMQIFEKAKERISEISHMLIEVKKIKEDEEQQLNSWEKEIQIVKEQIEKIDKELFSKI